MTGRMDIRGPGQDILTRMAKRRQSPWGGHQEGTVHCKHGAGTDGIKTGG